MDNLPPQLTPQSQSPMQGMQGNMNQMMEGADQMPSEQGESEKIVAYFDPGEINSLYENGLASIDPETNLFDATPLDKLLRIPEFREAISSQFSQQGQNFADGGEVKPGRPTDPELEKLRMEGTGDDKELVIITPFILETLTELAGREPKTNPHNGLPEFGWFHEIIRAVGAIGGAILGGPIGAGLGRTLAGAVTGQSLGNAARAGLQSGALSLGANAIAGLTGLGGAIPGLGGGVSGLLGGGMYSPLSGLKQLIGTPGGGLVSGMKNVVGADTVGKMLPASAYGGNSIQAAGQSGGGGGFLGNILGGGIGNVLPLVGSGLLMAKGHRDEQKSIRDYQKALQESENRQKAETEAQRERMGFNDKLKPVEPYRRRQIEPNITREQYLRGVEPRYFENYAEGGAIKGIGKGQQDNIPKDIKENSYIIDASTVSDIGDGSTDAGFKELDRYFSQFPSSESNSNESKAKGGFIKAMVSDGEYEIPPEKVTAIGGGSNEKGAKILKKFVEQVRSRKRTSGEKLPPKSKPVGGYLSQINRSAA